MIIIRLAGTSGSGKSTVVRELIEKRRALPFTWPDVEGQKKPPKIRGYNFPLETSRGDSWAETQMKNQAGVIVGRYNLTTSGADNSFNSKKSNAAGVMRNSMERLEDEIRYWAEPPNRRPLILFEGLIVTSVWSRWIRLSQTHPEYGMVFAFMNTPLDLCRERIQQRNQGKPRSGNFERQDRNLVSKFEGVERQLEDCRGAGWRKWIKPPQAPVTGGSLDWRVIRHDRALEDLEAIIDGAALVAPPTFVRAGDREHHLDEYL